MLADCASPSALPFWPLTTSLADFTRARAVLSVDRSNSASSFSCGTVADSSSSSFSSSSLAMTLDSSLPLYFCRFALAMFSCARTSSKAPLAATSIPSSCAVCCRNPSIRSSGLFKASSTSSSFSEVASSVFFSWAAFWTYSCRLSLPPQMSLTIASVKADCASTANFMTSVASFFRMARTSLFTAALTLPQ